MDEINGVNNNGGLHPLQGLEAQAAGAEENFFESEEYAEAMVDAIISSFIFQYTFSEILELNASSEIYEAMGLNE